MSVKKSRLIALLASPNLVFWLLPWLMVLLVIGTISQRYLGLYEAQRLFFSGWVVWFGPIPLPGLYSVLALMVLGLSAKLLIGYQWNRKQLGSILTHAAVLVLLLGGLWTALAAEEGYITLFEGKQGRMVSDYHQRELAVFVGDERVAQIPFEQLQGTVSHNTLPFDLKVITHCKNCAPVMREEADDTQQGMAGKVRLKPSELEKQDEANQYGVEFTLEGDEGAALYFLYEALPRPVNITQGEKTYRLLLHKQQRVLPFSITLNRFTKMSYGGSAIAEDYESIVTITEASGATWQAPIRMNEPLRVDGYTLYQSSFITVDGALASVLAVVKNKGFWFPYFASLLMAIGLLLQSLQRFKRVKK